MSQKQLSTIVKSEIQRLQNRIDRANRRIERASRQDEPEEEPTDDEGEQPKKKSKKRMQSPENKATIARETEVATRLQGIIEHMRATNTLVHDVEPGSRIGKTQPPVQTKSKGQKVGV